MGTRGVVGVRINGQDKIAYSHWDSYPSGLGRKVLEWLRQAARRDPTLEQVREQALALTLVNPRVPPTPEQIARCAPWTDLTVSKQSTSDWYCLLRNTQGDLEATLDAGLLVPSHDFLLDSVFCEWGWIVNLDTNELEVYRGFQDKPHMAGRYALNTAYLKEQKADRRTNPRLAEIPLSYPCKLVGAVPFVQLTTANLDTFLTTLEEDE